MKIDRINSKAGYTSDNCVATTRLYYYRVQEWQGDVQVGVFYEWAERMHDIYPNNPESNFLWGDPVATALIKYK
jgi:hypothetical protein